MTEHITVKKIQRLRADTYPIRFALKQADAVTPLDITGYTFLLTVDLAEDPPDATNNLFQVTGTLTDPVNGVVDFFLSDTDSDQTPGDYFYDAQLKDTAGKRRTFCRGSFQFEQDITKVL